MTIYVVAFDSFYFLHTVNERSKDSMQQTEERTYIYPFNNPKNNEKFHLAIIFSIKIYVSVILVC